MELRHGEVKEFAQSHGANQWCGCTSTLQLTNSSRKFYLASELNRYADHTDFVYKNACKITSSWSHGAQSSAKPSALSAREEAAPLRTHVYICSPTSSFFPNLLLPPFVPTATASCSKEKQAPFFLLKNTYLSLPSPRLSSIQHERVGVQTALDDNYINPEKFQQKTPGLRAMGWFL